MSHHHGIRGVTKILTFTEMIQMTFGSSLILYLPMNEAAGSPEAADLTGNDRDATAVHVTFGAEGIGDNQSCALFNATTSTLDIIGTALTSLLAALNIEEYTVGCFLRVASPTDWSGGDRNVFRADSHMMRSGSGNLTFYYNGGSKFIAHAMTQTGWIWAVGTVSRGADEMKFFVNGAQVETTLNTLPVGSVPTTWSIGNHAGIEIWDGDLAHFFLVDRVATPTEIATIYAHYLKYRPAWILVVPTTLGERRLVVPTPYGDRLMLVR